MSKIYKVGVLGSTGYTGLELVRILERHPSIEIKFLASQQYAGRAYNSVYPELKTDIQCINADDDFMSRLQDVDLVFFATPNGIAHKYAQALINKGVHVIDLSADYRFKNLATYEKWYGFKREDHDLASRAIYGLVELNRSQILQVPKPVLVANPGCYTTAAILSLMPLFEYDRNNANKFVDYRSIVIDGKSGVSGAGRKADVDLLYSELNENAYAYKLANQHRHGPELENILGEIAGVDNLQLCFAPHIIPMTQGMLVTSYVKLNQGLDLNAIYEDFYSDEYFVNLSEKSPQTKWVKGTNRAIINLNYDPRLKQLIISTAIDNLLKGASSQAIQNMNLILGLDEKTALI